MGQVLYFAGTLFLIAFAIGTVISIVKGLLERRKAAALKQNINEKTEVDQRNEP